MRKRTPEVSPVEPAKTPALTAYRKILARDPCAYCGHLDVRIVWDDYGVEHGPPDLERCPIAAYAMTDGLRRYSRSNYDFRVVGSQRDHVTALAVGGADVWDNLTASCARCNRAKRTKSLLHFMLERAS